MNNYGDFLKLKHLKKRKKMQVPLYSFQQHKSRGLAQSNPYSSRGARYINARRSPGYTDQARFSPKPKNIMHLV